MRVQGNTSPTTHIEPYLSTNLVELRVYENIKQISDDLYEYDEYVFHVSPITEEEVNSNLQAWIETGRTIEQNYQATPYVEKVEEVQKVQVEKVSYEEQGVSLLTQVVASGIKPSAKMGVFAKDYEEWQPNQNYKANTLLQYKGDLVYVVQDVLSLEVYPPFSAGLEAIYNARPYPIDYASNLYPYVYTMEVEVGMRLQTDEGIYVCKEYLDRVLYHPKDLARYFDKEA